MKKSICYIITQGEFGGAQHYVFDLAAHFAKTGYEILVLVGAQNLQLQEKLETAGIPVRIVKNLIRRIAPIRDFLAIREIRKILREFQPSLVHLNSSKAGVLGSIAGRLAGIKNIVFTAHGFAFLEPQPLFFKKSYFWAEKLATCYRKMIITVSDFDRLAAEKSKIGPKNKFITIHNGIDLETDLLDKATARARLEKLTGQTYGPESILVGTIAHNYPTKDLATLKTALQIARKKIPQLRGVIIGEGNAIGAIPDAAALLPAFDIFALSSRKEGFPYTILEAMRAGLPIVATAVGGIPEAIADNQTGLLVPARAPEALAEALQKLARSPNLQKTLGTAAREKVKQFSLQRMLKETETLYQKLISS